MERLLFIFLNIFMVSSMTTLNTDKFPFFPSSHSWGEHFKGATDGEPGNVVSKMIHPEAIVTNPMILSLIPVDADFLIKSNGEVKRNPPERLINSCRKSCSIHLNYLFSYDFSNIVSSFSFTAFKTSLLSDALKEKNPSCVDSKSDLFLLKSFVELAAVPDTTSWVLHFLILPLMTCKLCSCPAR